MIQLVYSLATIGFFNLYNWRSLYYDWTRLFRF